MLAPSVRFAPCARFSGLDEEPGLCECCGWSDSDHDDVATVIVLRRPFPESLAS